MLYISFLILLPFTILDLREIPVIVFEASPAFAFPNQPSRKSS